jgi:hypothetical protein
LEKIICNFFGFVKSLVFVDALGCFAPAAVATIRVISLKKVCLIFLSLKEYPGFQPGHFFIDYFAASDAPGAVAPTDVAPLKADRPGLFMQVNFGNMRE